MGTKGLQAQLKECDWSSKSQDKLSYLAYVVCCPGTESCIKHVSVFTLRESSYSDCLGFILVLWTSSGMFLLIYLILVFYLSFHFPKSLQTQENICWVFTDGWCSRFREYRWGQNTVMTCKVSPVTVKTREKLRREQHWTSVTEGQRLWGGKQSMTPRSFPHVSMDSCPLW